MDEAVRSETIDLRADESGRADPETNAADQTRPAVVLIDGDISISDAAAVALGQRRLRLGPTALARISAGRRRLRRAIDERRVVYGLTTGFGPLANRLTAPEDLHELQRNLIYHLASGVGRPLSWAAARATTLARLTSIARGWSGASETCVALLVALLDSDLAPRIPEKGTVGASGDLTPLAHLALALLGEGGFIARDGSDVSNSEAFRRLGRAPLEISDRDGLALVNGVSAMTGVALLNAALAARLIGWSEALQVAHADLLSGRLEAWAEAFARARPHPGQIEAQRALSAHAAGSERLIRTRAAERVLAPDAAARAEATALQDPYSIRCAPQIFGAVRDAARHHHDTVWRELNAASDNPIFDEDAPFAYHGGNFMGCHVALASDALTNAVLVLAGHAERRIARLCDEKKNGGLPPFLHRGPAGLNSGFMGAQVTATALLAEMRARGGAASIQSLPTNGDNQDVVSMGTIAARGAADALEGTSEILAIEALMAAQGHEIMLERRPNAAPARATAEVHAAVRPVAPPLCADRPLSDEIARMAKRVRDTGL